MLIPRKDLARGATILGLLAVITSGHFLTPTAPHILHSAHVLLWKLYMLPIVLGAIWYGLPGAVVTALLVTIADVPHIEIQWAGNIQENINQFGELGSYWVIALVTGVLAGREKAALRRQVAIHEGALMALVSALDAREHHTQRHSLRVREYSLIIARYLGLAESDYTDLSEGALLHDIGKIGVPDHILLKQGALTEDEWTMIREHPESGRRILGSAPSLAKAATVVYSHHEKFDGTGYPMKLAGNDIPLGARIFAVADAFDALTNDRPYRKGTSIEQARDEIRRHSGSQFDPKVVDAFCSVTVEQLERIACALGDSISHFHK